MISLYLKHVFLFVFSVDKACCNLNQKWVPCVPSALVCNKIYLRSHPVYSDRMHLLLDDIDVNIIRQSCGISSPFECSAVTGETVEQVFIGAAMLANKITPKLGSITKFRLEMGSSVIAARLANQPTRFLNKTTGNLMPSNPITVTHQLNPKL
ncbi:hypothetical protein CEXT_189661 [Caerostris extrusa]|uniref:Uncharacterized protein n=1 Tax=Caerostris extrusa TaxID=172846 RepID=A0AAV4X2D6_CAEEX|nr:hypothetical protein CEXT_189661 [Caerostris extrusa]